MKKNKASNRYARALFETAQSNNQLDSVFKDTQLVLTILSSNVELSELVQNPTINPKSKQRALSNTFSNYLEGVTLRLFDMIVSKGRDHLLFQILESYQKLYFEFNNEVFVTVTSAKKLSESQIELIKQKFKKGGKVKIKENIDSTMLGGITINTNDTQYSTCVKTKIEMIKKSLQL